MLHREDYGWAEEMTFLYQSYKAFSHPWAAANDSLPILFHYWQFQELPGFKKEWGNKRKNPEYSYCCRVGRAEDYGVRTLSSFPFEAQER
jgi:hypothetical protein